MPLSLITVMERMTVANQMISLVGSLQEDPFSPEHVPIPLAPPKAQEDVAVEDDFPEELENTDEEDGFEALSRMRENALAAENAKKDVLDDQEDNKKKKKKRKKHELEGDIESESPKKVKKKKVPKEKE